MKIGFMAILGLIFLTLKLCKVITWSWWLVLMPFYIGFAFIVLIIVSALFVALMKK